MAEANGSPNPEIEARRLGWKPEAEFRGDKTLWIDADTFLERGRHVMPILQANNKILSAQLSDATAAISNLKATIATQAESMKAITEFQAAEVKRQVSEQVGRIRKELAEARKDGDTDTEIRLEGELDAAKDRLKKVEEPAAKPAPTAAATQEEPEPWAREFTTANADWYNKDRKKTAMFVAECQEVFETSTLRGAPLLEEAKRRMEAFFEEPGNRPDKSESGSRPGGASGGGSAGPKTYASLPADAKAQVEAEMQKMVGPKKPFKTPDEWKKHFTAVYYAT